MTANRFIFIVVKNGLMAAILGTCFWTLALLAADTGAVERSVWDGVYTDVQAKRGEGVFTQSCVACHATKLGEAGGHGPAPSVIGEDFSFRWTDAAIVDLYDTIRQTMPEAAPNSLSAAEYADLTAYLLKLNNYPSGAVELDPAQREILQLIYIDETPP